MQLFVKTHNNKRLILEVDPRDIVGHIKELIEERESIPVHEQRLLFEGREVKNHFSISEYHIPEESTLYLVLRGRIIFF